MARSGAQLLTQAALEAEVTEFLGRDRYHRAAACPDARPGSRRRLDGISLDYLSRATGPPRLAGDRECSTPRR